MISAEIFQLLEPISKTYRLLPVGNGPDWKGPFLKDWPKNPACRSSDSKAGESSSPLASPLITLSAPTLMASPPSSHCSLSTCWILS